MDIMTTLNRGGIMKIVLVLMVMLFCMCGNAWGLSSERSGLIYYPTDGTSLVAINSAIESRGLPCEVKFTNKGSGVSTPYIIPSGVTFSDLATYSFEPGAELVPDGNNVIMPLENIVALDNQQIFDLSSGGTITALNPAYSSLRWYGSEGDDATNDTLAIQAALNNRGEIYAPPGTYRFNGPLKTYTKTRIYGGGRQITFFKLLSTTTSATFFESVTGDAADYIHIQDMTLNGNSSVVGDTSPAILISDGTNPQWCRFEDLYLVQLNGGGIQINSGNESYLNDVLVYNTESFGFRIASGDVSLSNCSAGLLAGYGFYMSSTGRMDSCYAWRTGEGAAGYGFRITGPGCILSNSFAQHCNGDALQLDDKSIIVSSFNAEGCHLDGIVFESDADNCVVEAAIWDESGDPYDFNDGVDFQSGATNNYVTCSIDITTNDYVSGSGVTSNNLLVTNRENKSITTTATTFGPNAELNSKIYSTLNSNTTVNDLVGNFTNGLEFEFYFTQDAIGGRTVNFAGSDYITDFVAATGALETSSVTFKYDGVLDKWVQSGKVE